MEEDQRDANARDPREPAVPPPGNDALSGARFAGIGIQFAISILLFLYAGKWLDAKLGTAPWLLIAGVFVGAAASFYSMYRALTRPPRG
jgi:ATP synthase protein I